MRMNFFRLPERSLAAAVFAGVGIAAISASCGDRHAEPKTLIAFSHSFEPKSDILLMQPDGSNVRRVRALPGAQFDPALSPDGRAIAFRDSRAGINRNDEIYVVRTDGSGLENLTRDAANDWSPAWSPDGKTIVFASTRNGGLSLWTIAGDGTGARQLTRGGNDEYPAWSPDNEWIAFSRFVPGSQSDVWLVSADGSKLRVLTNGPEPEWLPTWSPDGKSIAYVRGWEGATAVWVMKADGSDQHAITRGHNDMGPSWSPNGGQLVFSRDGTLYVIAVDGGHARSLGVEGALPSWGLEASPRSGTS